MRGVLVVAARAAGTAIRAVVRQEAIAEVAHVGQARLQVLELEREVVDAAPRLEACGALNAVEPGLEVKISREVVARALRREPDRVVASCARAQVADEPSSD